MSNLKRIVVMLAIAVSLGAFSASAQVYVNVRPVMPHYERHAAPSNRHVWIDEDWEPRGGTYAFVGGHWAVPPHMGMVWVPGRWRQGPHGWIWIKGRWR